MSNRIATVAIVDYQMSNLFSVQHACEYIDLRAIITSDPAVLLAADAAILPGVGAFGDAMANLERLDLVAPIKQFIASGRPFMGVCLGLQLLFTESDEFGHHRGLDIIAGHVTKFPGQNADGQSIKVPQIAWNTIHHPRHQPDRWPNSPLRSTVDGEFMYFVHSFYVTPANERDIITLTAYEGFEYCSGILRDNVFAVQFHPEKSGPEGIKIYRAWASPASNGT